MKVLYECHDLTLQGGTGIATYIRSLAKVAKELGYRTQALHGVSHRIGKNQSLLDEVRLHDPGTQRRPSALTRHARTMLAVADTALGVAPSRLEKPKFVIDPSRGQIFDSFDDVLVATRLFDRARVHLRVYNDLLKLRLRSPPDIFHASRPVPVRAAGSINVYTIHDLIPLILPYTTLDNKRLLYKVVQAIADKADHIITVSENSKRDIIKILGVGEDRVTNAYQAVSFPEEYVGRSEDELAEELQRSYGLRYGEYFLHYGAVEPKKNIRRLVEAYRLSGIDRPLILAGQLGWMYEQDLEAINDEGFLRYTIRGESITKSTRVRRLPYLTRRRLVALIKGARAVLFPSLYEGFGLPVLEAMLLGTPVMTSNTSSLSEIGHDAAVLVDPYDVERMAEAIRSLDCDADLRMAMRERGVARAAVFSTENYKARIADIYGRLLS